MTETIVSKDNQKVKNLRALLRDKKARRSENKFVAEGVTLVKETPSLQISEVYVREGEEELLTLAKEKSDRVFILSEPVFNGLSDTVKPSGILAVVSINEENCSLGNKILLLDGIRDPGNIGTLIRSAAGFRYDTVILSDSADPYEPKAVRSSMGGIFKVNTVRLKSADEAVNLLSDIPIIALDMGGEDISDIKVPERFALVVGSESHGVSEVFRKCAAKIAAIPADGIESLNAGVAGSVAMYAFSK